MIVSILLIKYDKTSLTHEYCSNNLTISFINKKKEKSCFYNIDAIFLLLNYNNFHLSDKL